MNDPYGIFYTFWIQIFEWIYRFKLKRLSKKLELDLLKLKASMENDGTWDMSWRTCHASLCLIPEELLDAQEADLLNVRLDLSTTNLSPWCKRLKGIIDVYLKNVEFRQPPKSARPLTGLEIPVPSNYQIEHDSLLMFIHGSEFTGLSTLTRHLIDILYPLVAINYEGVLDTADISYLDRTSGYMQDELFELTRAIIECAINIGNPVD